MSRTRLLEAKAWVFDLDGTLTMAQHDFAAIKLQLGLPENQGILESLSGLPPEIAREKVHRIDAWELEIAAKAQAAPGAQRLLESLLEQGIRLGILTRNTRRNAWETLRAAGLAHFFRLEEIIGRDDALPKPDPDGLLRLAKYWACEPERQVMVGDYLYDLEAGRAAGALTIHLDVHGVFRWPDKADLRITNYLQLEAVLAGDLVAIHKYVGSIATEPKTRRAETLKKPISITADADKNPNMGFEDGQNWF